MYSGVGWGTISRDGFKIFLWTYWYSILNRTVSVVIFYPKINYHAISVYVVMNMKNRILKMYLTLITIIRI